MGWIFKTSKDFNVVTAEHWTDIQVLLSTGFCVTLQVVHRGGYQKLAEPVCAKQFTVCWPPFQVSLCFYVRLTVALGSELLFLLLGKKYEQGIARLSHFFKITQLWNWQN